MNFIRMNLYRIFRGKALYVFSIITLLFVAFTALEQQGSEALTPEEVQLVLEETGESDAEEFGLVVGVNKIETLFDMCEEFIGSGLILVFTALFIVIYTNAERSGGFLKNLISIPGAKTHMVISKLIPVIIFVTIQLGIVGLASCTCGYVLTDKSSFFMYMLVQWVLHIAFGMMNVWVMEIFRNLTAGIIIGIFVPLGLLLMITVYIENAIMSVLGNMQFGISNYMIVSLVKGISAENLQMVTSTGIICGILGIIAYTAMTVWIARKRDVY